MNSLPKISVVTITYGHQDYITETLDGVFMQQYDGPIEFIIANDNSPDNTDEVIKDYLTTRQIPANFEVKYTKHCENLGVTGNFIWSMKQATGKYMALCEGDDFWIDPLKLQKQCDFLENNDNYSLVVGGYLIQNSSFDINQIKISDSLPTDNSVDGFDITLESFFTGSWLTKTLTLFFRSELFNFDVLKRYKYGRDVHLNYHLLTLKKGYYMKTSLGVYRKHDGGIFSSLTENNELRIHCDVYSELYNYNKNRYTKNSLFNAMIAYGRFNKLTGFKSFILINNYTNFKVYCSFFLNNIFNSQSKQ